MTKLFSLVSEFFATFLLVLSILITNGNVLFVGVTFMGLLLLTGKVSGGHLNPAVSLAMYAKRKYPLSTILLYIASQLLGGVLSVYVYNKLA
jgi:glycerol uptake facilitator-like aquaporin